MEKLENKNQLELRLQRHPKTTVLRYLFVYLSILAFHINVQSYFEFGMAKFVICNDNLSADQRFCDKLL